MTTAMETTYESEIQLAQLFKSLGAAFARLAKGMEPVKEQQELKDITKKLHNVKGYLCHWLTYCVFSVTAAIDMHLTLRHASVAGSYESLKRRPGLMTCGPRRSPLERGS